MKKFLSILLAVMMVLSTVSYAIPSAIGAMDTAVETPVEEVPVAVVSEETASLAATDYDPTDTSVYGNLLYQVNYNSGTADTSTGYTSSTWTAFGVSATSSQISSTTTNYKMDNQVYKAHEGNSSDLYLYGTLNTGSPLINMAPGGGWTTVFADGVYTYTVDLKFDIPDDATVTLNDNNNMLRFNNSLSTDDQRFVIIDDDEWHTYVLSYEQSDTSVLDINGFQLYANGVKDCGGSVSIDNINIYYKPLTVNVTYTLDGETLATNAVSTTGVTVSDMVSGLDVGTPYIVSAIKINGTTYNADDTVTLCTSDVEAELILADNPNYDVHKGNVVFHITFDSLTAGSTPATYPFVSAVGYNTDAYEILDDVTPRLFLNNFGTLSAVANGDGVALQSTASGTGTTYWYVQHHIDATGATGAPLLDPAVYTIEYDAKYSAVPTSQGISYYMSNGSGATHTWKFTKTLAVSDTDWHTYSHTYDATGDTYGPSYIDVRYVAAAAGDVAQVDNFKVYAKPATTTVTAMVGDEAFGTATVSTQGVTADAFIANFDLGNASQVITGVIFDGVTYTGTDSMVFGGENTVELVVEDNPYFDAEYGDVIFKQHFDGTTTGYTTTSTWQNNDEMKNGRYTENIIEVKDFNMGVPSGAVVTEDTEGNGKGKYLSAILPLTSNDEVLRLAITGGTDVVGVTAKGVYTFTYDLRLSTDTVLGSSTTNFIRLYYKPDGGTKAYETTNTTFVADGEWHTYTATILIDDDKYSLQDIYAYMHAVKNATAGTADFDNFTVYYKAPTTTVTFLPGTAVNVEAQTATVSTAGFKASDIKNLIDTSASSKQVVGVKNVLTGKTYGSDDVIYVGGNCELELIWGESDLYDATYGDLVLNVDFESIDTATLTRWSKIGIVGGQVYNVAENITAANTAFDWSGVYSSNPTNDAATAVGPDGSKAARIPHASTGLLGWGIYDASASIGSGNFDPMVDPGVYTLEFDVKLGSATSDARIRFGASTVNNSSPENTSGAYTDLYFMDQIVDTTGWNHVVLSIDMSDKEYGLGLIRAYVSLTEGSEALYDNIVLYSKPEKATVNVILDGEKYSFEAGTNGLTVAQIIAQSGITCENVYETIVGVNYDGVDYAETDTLSFASDITVTAVKGLSSTLTQDKGQIALHVDFDSIEAGLSKWPSLSQVGGTNYLINGTGVGVNFSFSNYLSANLTTDNYSVHTDDSDLALRFVKPDDGWHNFSIYDGNTGGGGNYDQFLEPGVYYIEFDAKFSVVPNNMMIRPGRYLGNADPGAEGNWVQTNFTVPDTEWNHYGVFVDYSEYAEGLASVQFFVNAATGTVCEYDNIKIWYKPSTTTVSFVLDGETEATKEDVAIIGTTVAELLDGVKVSGYTVTGMKYAGKTYAADATDEVVFAQSAETVYLTADKLDTSEFVPTTVEEADVRAELDETGEALDEKSGIRFKAQMATADESVIKAGWIVTTTAKLEAAEISAENLELDTDVVKVVGYNIDEDGTEKIYASENNVDTFAAVLYGIPEENYLDGIVARPFVIDATGTWYGAAYTVSYGEAALAVLDAQSGNLTEDQELALALVVSTAGL